jgi:hypothetical protein
LNHQRIWQSMKQRTWLGESISAEKFSSPEGAVEAKIGCAPWVGGDGSIIGGFPDSC